MTLPRVYPIADSGALAARGYSPAAFATALLDGGAAILQFRHKGHWSREVFEQAGRIAAMCRERGVLFVVNDRADMAMLLDAALHVGHDDLPVTEARRLIGPGRRLGFSTHNDRQLLAAADAPIDYVALGPIFLTGSKENPDPLVGVERLREWRGLARRPLVAIGGITRAAAPQVLEAGADSVAVIGGLLPETLTAETLRERMEEWRRITEM